MTPLRASGSGGRAGAGRSSEHRRPRRNRCDRTVPDMHRVAIAVHEHTMLFELAIAVEVFGVDRSALSPTGDWYELTACTPDGAPSPWLPGTPTRDLAA